MTIYEHALRTIFDNVAAIQRMQKILDEQRISKKGLSDIDKAELVAKGVFIGLNSASFVMEVAPVSLESRIGIRVMTGAADVFQHCTELLNQVAKRAGGWNLFTFEDAMANLTIDEAVQLSNILLTIPMKHLGLGWSLIPLATDHAVRVTKMSSITGFLNGFIARAVSKVKLEMIKRKIWKESLKPLLLPEPVAKKMSSKNIALQTVAKTYFHIPPPFKNDLVFQENICPITRYPIRTPACFKNEDTFYERAHLIQWVKNNPGRIPPNANGIKRIADIEECPGVKSMINRRLHELLVNFQKEMRRKIEREATLPPEWKRALRM